ncbi:MAG: effector binding domain-containing protein [Longimicrobiaceae bacterium]
MDVLTPVRFEEGQPMLLGGLRRRHEYAAAEAGIAAQWREFLAAEPVPGRVGPELYGVMGRADPTGFEYMCGVEVESFAALPVETGRMRVPAVRYAVFAHGGAAVSLRSTWQRVFEWLAAGPYDSAHTPDFELYAPGADPLTGAGEVEIWLGVVPRSGAE